MKTHDIVLCLIVAVFIGNVQPDGRLLRRWRRVPSTTTTTSPYRTTYRTTASPRFRSKNVTTSPATWWNRWTTIEPTTDFWNRWETTTRSVNDRLGNTQRTTAATPTTTAETWWNRWTTIKPTTDFWNRWGTTTIGVTDGWGNTQRTTAVTPTTTAETWWKRWTTVKPTSKTTTEFWNRWDPLRPTTPYYPWNPWKAEVTTNFWDRWETTKTTNFWDRWDRTTPTPFFNIPDVTFPSLDEFTVPDIPNDIDNDDNDYYTPSYSSSTTHYAVGFSVSGFVLVSILVLGLRICLCTRRISRTTITRQPGPLRVLTVTTLSAAPGPDEDTVRLIRTRQTRISRA